MPCCLHRPQRQRYCGALGQCQSGRHLQLGGLIGRDTAGIPAGPPAQTCCCCSCCFRAAGRSFLPAAAAAAGSSGNATWSCLRNGVHSASMWLSASLKPGLCSVITNGVHTRRPPSLTTLPAAICLLLWKCLLQSAHQHSECLSVVCSTGVFLISAMQIVAGVSSVAATVAPLDLKSTPLHMYSIAALIPRYRACRPHSRGISSRSNSSSEGQCLRRDDASLQRMDGIPAMRFLFVPLHTTLLSSASIAAALALPYVLFKLLVPRLEHYHLFGQICVSVEDSCSLLCQGGRVEALVSLSRC